MATPENQMDPITELKAMMARYRNGQATQAERVFLEQYDQLFDREEGLSQQLSETETAEWYARLDQDMQQRLSELKPETEAETDLKQKGKLVPMLNPVIKRVSAVAAAIILIAAGWWWFSEKNKSEAPIAKVQPVLAPDRNRAMVTLGDGRTVYLDQVQNGELADISGLKLVKTADGQVVYQGVATGEKVVTNKVSNPRGSRNIEMTLSDGTRIRLNAGSSITYNVPFNQRNVQLEGEAYFEVTKDAQHPFTVAQEDTKVQVLGTHFNVKAYREDGSIKVTLIEGSVKVAAKHTAQMLQPGEQAIIAEGHPTIQLVREADTEEALAWMNGQTSFHGAEFQAVLNEIRRWYDIEVEIKADASTYAENSFYVNVNRNAPLRDVLESVLTNNKVRFHFDEQARKLTILP